MAATLQLPALQIPISPGANIDAYLAAISTMPLLTAEKEVELGCRLVECDDVDAARQLVMSQLRFVASMAKRYLGYGLPLADLIQEGNVGLMKAVKRFNPHAGVRLITFAVHYIRSEIHDYVIRNWRTVRVATTKAQRKLFFNLRKLKRRSGWLTETEAQTVARQLGVTMADVKDMEGRLAGNDVSFDQDGEDEPASNAPWMHLPDSRYDPARVYEQDVISEHRHSMLYDALATLDERSQDILTQRWLTDEKATLQELAGRHNVSAERIRQLEKAAMLRLRAALPAAA